MHARLAAGLAMPWLAVPAGTALTKATVCRLAHCSAGNLVWSFGLKPDIKRVNFPETLCSAGGAAAELRGPRQRAGAHGAGPHTGHHCEMGQNLRGGASPHLPPPRPLLAGPRWHSPSSGKGRFLTCPGFQQGSSEPFLPLHGLACSLAPLVCNQQFDKVPSCPITQAIVDT